ncbi:MurR/RpiR family transcriptional regulator [Streptomyces celluloflavus]|uniref:MurR/RpiR family transcriptional regulator n=1 Tax=Streptomyces celluloflavus TaxID=58344 RepID=A0ABW7RPS1_9ACTN|nr:MULTISPECIES: MurR/RpiR family transcriptional regulator [Streptomyces]MYU54312.1 SIS domain-containing protein [Streptomyces sp. SID7805]WSK15846.1 MurR/RpiR family transcriptional regulator [Streptomyces celluloflavus]
MRKTTEETFAEVEIQHPLPAKVRSLVPSLGAQQQRVARALLADPVACSRMSVSDLADHAHTSDTTVVRTARLLGYAGYRELRRALVELAAVITNTQAVPTVGAVALNDPLDRVVAKLAAEERQILADTASQLDIDALDAAVTAISRARRIDVYGIGSSGSVADDLAAKLMRIGRVAHAHSDAHRAMTSAVHLGEEDVAIGISHSGTTLDVVDPLRTAADNGATTVTLTSRPRSPAAHYADVVLATAAAAQGSDLRSVSMSSRTSQLLVVDCLVTGVAQRTYHSGAQRGLAASFRAVLPRHQANAPTDR